MMEMNLYGAVVSRLFKCVVVVVNAAILVLGDILAAEKEIRLILSPTQSTDLLSTATNLTVLGAC